MDLESCSFRSVQGLVLPYHHGSAGCSSVPHCWDSFGRPQLRSHLVYEQITFTFNQNDLGYIALALHENQTHDLAIACTLMHSMEH